MVGQHACASLSLEGCGWMGVERIVDVLRRHPRSLLRRVNERKDTGCFYERVPGCVREVYTIYAARTRFHAHVTGFWSLNGIVVLFLVIVFRPLSSSWPFTAAGRGSIRGRPFIALFSPCKHWCFFADERGELSARLLLSLYWTFPVDETYSFRVMVISRC